MTDFCLIAVMIKLMMKKNKIIIIIINVMTSICLKKKFRVNIEWSNTCDHMAYLDIYFLFQHLVKRTNTHALSKGKLLV